MSILLTDEEIVVAEIESYANGGFPVTDVCRYANIENRGVAKAQLKKVVGWGDEPCYEHLSPMGGLPVAKHSCEICWQALKEEAGL